MGVAVLHPQDCLKGTTFSHQRLISPPSSKPTRFSNSNRLNRPIHAQSNRSNKSPSWSNNTPLLAKSLVVGQVRILKRGEEQIPSPSFDLVKKDKIEDRSDLGLIVQSGPGPATGPAQIQGTESTGVGAFYAGPSALIASPPPSSVPLPVFFTRKSVSISNVDATSELRRILRLDLG